MENERGAPMMRWVRLERRNNWGIEYFVAPGAPGAPREPRMEDRRAAVTFQNNQPLAVRWPDGSETHERVTHKTFVADIDDHGHRMSTPYPLPGVLVFLRGISQWVPLDAVEIEMNVPEETP